MTLLSENTPPNEALADYPVARYARHDAYFKAHDDVQTPCLLLDLDMVAERLRSLREALPNVEVYYAVKACAAPELLRLMVRLGCGFDVASTGEIDMVLAAGADPAMLSFGHTVKTRSAIEDAWKRGVKLFAFDSPEELAKIADAAPGAEVVCRITVDTTGSQWGPTSRKFGCGGPEQAVELLLQAARLGLRPKALTFHVGSQQREPSDWDIAISRCATITRELAAHGVEIEVLNLGGGLPSQYGDALPQLSAYADAIYASLARHFPNTPRLLIEPGRFLSGDAGLIRSKVVLATTRADTGKRWVYVDVGRFGGLAETEGEVIRFPLVALRDGTGLDSPAAPAVLAGPTCDPADVMYEREPRRLPIDLTAGDQLDFLAAGAYTAPYASVAFNGFAPMRTYCFGGAL